jgi:hypothetical protein
MSYPAARPLPPIPPLAPRPVQPEQVNAFAPHEGQRIQTPALGGGSTLRHPFQIYDATAPEADPPAARIDVRPGTLQNMDPTGRAGPHTLADGTHYLYLDVEINLLGAIVGVDMVINTSAQPAVADYHAYITLGTVTVDGDIVTVVNQAVTHNLRFRVCDRVIDEETLTDRGTYHFWGMQSQGALP